MALDHNFPEPVLASVGRWLKDVEFHRLRGLDPVLAELQDHDLIYDLHDRGLSILVTHNWKMQTTRVSSLPGHCQRTGISDGSVSCGSLRPFAAMIERGFTATLGSVSVFKS